MSNHTDPSFGTTIEDETISRDYFDRIVDCWAPFRDVGLIIPFCTPVLRNPTVLVIGTNHSWFDPNLKNAGEIDHMFATGVPKVNTFCSHNHRFAKVLRSRFATIGTTINETWMGTNRCAVQTGSVGLRSLKKRREFKLCQKNMDDIPVEIIERQNPRTILLCGNYAQSLATDERQTTSKHTTSILEPLNSWRSRVVAIPHPCGRESSSETIARIRSAF